MYQSIPLIILAVGIAAVPALVGEAHEFESAWNIAPPVDFAGMSVTVGTRLTHYDITAEEPSPVNMAVRLFDLNTDQTLEKVTCRISIWRDGGLLARQLFYAADGKLDIEIRPVADCDSVDLWRCAKYFGSEHPDSPGAQYAQGNQDLVIQGPIFDRGGLYNIHVDVGVAASSEAPLTSPLSFDTFASVAQEQPFAIQTASAEIPVVVKSYYDTVENFGFDHADDSISFDMPFDWSPGYVEFVPVIREELRIPKSFEPYSEGSGFRGFVNGIEVDRRYLILDPYTHEDLNILHFLVYGRELQRINNILGEENRQSGLMSFVVVPESKVQKNTLDFYLVDPHNGDRTGASVSVSWDDRYGVGGGVLFEFAFLDGDGNLLKDVRYSYALHDHGTGNVLVEDIGSDDPGPGISAVGGIDLQTLPILSQSSYRLDVSVLGQVIDGVGFDGAYAGIGSALIEVRPSIPAWIKTTAGFWTSGVTSDAEFVSAIQFLIDEGIIAVPVTESESDGAAGIPPWIKTMAQFWVDGTTTDNEFVSAIQFLIGAGIIVT